MNESSYWRFSLSFYAEHGVAEACLALQGEQGVDVNVLLYLLFLARERRALDASDIARIESIADAWRDGVVIPLRGVRSRLKGTVGVFEPSATAALRTEVKRIELAAERLQQETMERLAPAATLGAHGSDRNACARNNLAQYGERFGSLSPSAVAIILDRFARAGAAD